jgi:RNA polymerase sigma factor (sigma-70 family)
VELNEHVAIIEPPAQEVQDLHEALGDLEQLDPLKARIVDLRYFAGMSMKEAAEVLDLSERTLHRQWRFIKAWLKSRLEPE